MEKAPGMPQADRGTQENRASGVPSGPVSASPVPRFVVLNGHGGRHPPPPAAVAKHIPPKQPFTVRLKNSHEWTAARRPHETLQHFVAEVNRNAQLLHLIDDDERVLRLQLPGTPPKDLDVDATLGDVRICMRGGDDPVLLAVVAKLPTRTIAAPMIPKEINRDDPAGATKVRGAPKRKDQSSSPEAPSPLQERSVVIKRRLEPDLRVTESDLTSNMHLTLMEKAESLSISLTALKQARIELGMGRWRGRQERARLRHLRGPQEESRGSPSAVAESEPVGKPEHTEGHEGLRSCKQELP